MLGAVFILSALMLVRRREESPGPFIATVLAVLAIGSVCLYTEGEAYDDYFAYIQLTAVVYGILQAFVLSRLWQRRLDLMVSSEVSGWIAALPAADRAPDLELRRVDAEARAGAIRYESRTYSELLILTFLGAANVFILIVGRTDDFLGDSVCFLLGISITYLLSTSWALNFQITRFDAGGRAMRQDELADAVLSYVFLGVAVFAMLAMFYMRL